MKNVINDIIMIVGICIFFLIINKNNIFLLHLLSLNNSLILSLTHLPFMILLMGGIITSIFILKYLRLMTYKR